MWTHSDRDKDRVRATKCNVRGVREGEGFRFRQPPFVDHFSGVQGAVSGSSAPRTFDDGVGTLTEGLQDQGAEQRVQVVAEGGDQMRATIMTKNRAENASGCVES